MIRYGEKSCCIRISKLKKCLLIFRQYQVISHHRMFCNEKRKPKRLCLYTIINKNNIHNMKTLPNTVVSSLPCMYPYSIYILYIYTQTHVRLYIYVYYIFESRRVEIVRRHTRHSVAAQSCGC